MQSINVFPVKYLNEANSSIFYLSINCAIPSGTGSVLCFTQYMYVQYVCIMHSCICAVV